MQDLLQDEDLFVLDQGGQGGRKRRPQFPIDLFDGENSVFEQNADANDVTVVEGAEAHGDGPQRCWRGWAIAAGAL